MFATCFIFYTQKHIFSDSLIIVMGFLLLLVSDSSMSYLLFPGIIMMAVGGNCIFLATIQVSIDHFRYTAAKSKPIYHRFIALLPCDKQGMEGVQFQVPLSKRVNFIVAYDCHNECGIFLHAPDVIGKAQFEKGLLRKIIVQTPITTFRYINRHQEFVFLFFKGLELEKNEKSRFFTRSCQII